jgi:two-component system sensor histidine kinase YesM
MMNTEGYTEGFNRNRILLHHLKRLSILLLLPLVLLGFLSIIVTQSYIKDEVNKNNMITLRQISQQIDLILNEFETLSLNFSGNPNLIVPLKKVFYNSSFTYDDYKLFTVIKSYFESNSHVKPYVQSIYIYYDNVQDRLISSVDTGITNLAVYHDRAWYESYLRNKSVREVWSELRSVQRYSNDRTDLVLTVYKNLFTSNSSIADGVIVLNIKPGFIEELQNNAIFYPNQGLIVVNEKNEPVLSYNFGLDIGGETIDLFLQNANNYFSYTTNEKKYTVSKFYSEQYGWTYLSIIPNNTLYEVPTRLLYICLVLFVVCLFVGLLLAIYMTRINYLNFIKLVRILDSAKSGEHVPTLIKIKDEHSYLIRRMITTFIEQNYLKMQLSERKYKMKVAELLALQSQINPHFLYNTLHTISWKAIALTNRPNEVSEMIENLSSILKYAISNSNETVTLEEEIFYTQCYINIQSIRYRNKFKAKWNCDEGILDVRIMKLLLQPLIENSIYHGIKEKDSQGIISIKIIKDRNHLKIWLVDDGVGIEPRKLTEIRRTLRNESDIVHNEHIGLFNVNKRLILTYGESYGIRIKTIYRKGTAIYLKVPIDIER